MINLNPIIRTENLNVFIGKNQILRDINIKIPEKKITIIIGPSGCGKTTLLKSFNRIIELNEEAKITGNIYLNEQNIFEETIDIHDLRKKIGLLLQRPYPLPMSIIENIAFGLKIHNSFPKNEIRSIVEHNLKEVGLWDEVKDRINEPATGLSIGQQQRLSLARTLAIRPEVILCDEPTSALDPISSKKIESKLLELKNDYSIVLVTHILRQAKRLADFIIFIYLGEIIEYGTAEEFFENPKNEITKEYLKGIIS